MPEMVGDKNMVSGHIRKNRNQIKAIANDGTLRQILERGYLSDTEIQFVIDAVFDKLEARA